MEIFNRRFINQDIFLQLPFLQFTANPVLTVPKHVLPYISNILHRLEDEYTGKIKVDFDIVGANLLTLFVEINQFANEGKITGNAALRITQQYKNNLSQFIYEKQSVTDYAGMQAISPNHLNKCVKTTTGKSAQDLLTEMMILETKVLLKQTTLTLKEIAWKIGKDQSDLTRLFKLKTGLAPGEYRVID